MFLSTYESATPYTPPTPHERAERAKKYIKYYEMVLRHTKHTVRRKQADRRLHHWQIYLKAAERHVDMLGNHE